MQGAVRPYVTAGVALVGASVIAVSPVAPPVPDLKVAAMPSASTAMQLTSASNPLAALSDLFGNTLASGSGLLEQFLESPAPILNQVLVNQFANFDLVVATAQQIGILLPDLIQQVGMDLQKIASQLSDGNFVGAAQTLNSTLLIAGLPLLGLIGPPLAILQNTTQNIANVFAALPENVFPVIMSVIGPISSTINGVADIAQTVFDAARAGDFITAAGALVSAPIVMADVILNGFGGGVGLLTPQLNFFSSGPIGMLLGLRNVIADALNPIAVPTANAAANRAPDMQADVITVNLNGAAKTAGALEGASSELGDDTGSSGAVEGPEGSGVAAVSSEENDALGGSAAEEQEVESEEPAVNDDAPLDEDDESGLEDVDETGTKAGGGEVRESLVATPGQTGLSVGAGTGEGGEAPTEGNEASGGGNDDAGGSDDDGDADGDAGNAGGGSGSGGSGGGE